MYDGVEALKIGLREIADIFANLGNVLDAVHEFKAFK